MNNIIIILRKICEGIKSSYGSVDIIKTEGSQILEKEGEYWVNFLASNLYEIYTNSKEINFMFLNYENYSDAKEQFFYDVLAILEDLSYHSSIFNIYYFSSIKKLMDKEKNVDENIDDIYFFSKKINIDSIINIYDFSKKEKRKKIVINLIKISFFICYFYEKIKDDKQNSLVILDKLHTYSIEYIILYKKIKEYF